LANDLNPEVLHRLAKLGAQARLDQIEAERLAIVSAFPDLPGAKQPAAKRAGKAAVVVAKAAPARRRKKMSAAARRAVSERMRKFWAERRKAKGK
jgi:hypothetical protein